MLIAFVAAALAAPPPARICWVSAGLVLDVSQPARDGSTPRPGHLPAGVGASPMPCEVAARGWVYTGGARFVPPPEPEAPPDPVAEVAAQLKAVVAELAEVRARADTAFASAAEAKAVAEDAKVSLEP